MSARLSVLDLAPIAPGETPADSFRHSVALAQAAEAAGYERVWYAEHHNMERIASSATSVLIAHIAAHTESIRLGAGGVMLPNHSPLAIAEQFGTLAELHPGRIDLGLGRAPGGDRAVFGALRRDPAASDRFPQDVVELQGYLSDESRVHGVVATPGKGTHVPLYILGSSLFGAQLAAQLGLPYAFASHFAPAALHDAVAAYRAGFQPSDQLAQPYVIAGANAFAGSDEADAREQFAHARRWRVRGMIQRGTQAREYSDEEIDAFLATPQGQQLADMMRYTAIGTGDEVNTWLDDFASEVGADEVIVAHSAMSADARVESVRLTARA
ncbi:LLM class flavin-dependent oxidoreductase [Demequina muriae]|uniref:LLM class flavin-dependent oxidoreductase n=1 Tax=Demequina muriae TaxID=3051664 RepID=A0ABT8GI76_9MICO|nr:LLM class flavin-dependent oxidoreductase [Demequina sp. EGI L300058]MDN4480964.1 LLM class flavin-dependent oxidoreductase [Demequina sp. EGI L300058]